MSPESAVGLAVAVTYVGGPTALIEVLGLRFLTDPALDAAPSEYTTPVYTLLKTESPAVGAEMLGTVDAVLLSHDHHFDNLDRSGREFLSKAGRVLTTRVGAERLGGNATGLAAWEHVDLDALGGRRLRVTATPARHGPAGGDRGPVIGFLISDATRPESSSAPAVYVSGDTVWYDGLLAIADHADVRVAFLFLGAARVKEVGPQHLTMTAAEAVTFAKMFGNAIIVPLHFSGWTHFSEGRDVIQRAFDDEGLGDRLRWPDPGRETTI